MRPRALGPLLLLGLTACAAPSGSAAASGEAPAGATEVRVVPLQHVAAKDLAISLRPSLPAGVGFDILELPGMNSILLRGTPAQCDALATAIRALDRPGGG